jgi:hypothetical protein
VLVPDVCLLAASRRSLATAHLGARWFVSVLSRAKERVTRGAPMLHIGLSPVKEQLVR